MAAIEVGRVIVKTAGREALMKAVIVDLVDQNFVLISGGGISPVKRRRCNIKHIRPLEQMVSIKRGAKDEAIQKAIKKDGLIDELKTPLQITI
ncbi:MAG: 50S ribosomal protein L14e [Candidatus Hodarchaeales archaeon]|jgi:large subunit ribosomal protein L14e